MPGTHKYFLDDTFFDSIDSEAKAYWLGFLTADGCIQKGRCIQLALQADDKNHIEKFLHDINSTYPIHEYAYPTGGTLCKSAHLSMRSAHMVNSLKTLGVVERKSLIAKPCETVPQTLLRHYWRGLVDGDGYIGTHGHYWEIGLVGTKAIVEGFFNYTKSYTRSEAKPRKLHRIFRMSYGGIIEVRKIVGLLYDESTVHLDRKKIIADKVLSIQPKRIAIAPIEHQLSMIAAYQNGATAKESAAVFGYDKIACLGALKRRGIPRRKGITPEDDQLKMIQAYQNGASLVDTAAQYGYSSIACTNALIRHNIPIRKCGRHSRRRTATEAVSV